MAESGKYVYQTTSNGIRYMDNKRLYEIVLFFIFGFYFVGKRKRNWRLWRADIRVLNLLFSESGPQQATVCIMKRYITDILHVRHLVSLAQRFTYLRRFTLLKG